MARTILTAVLVILLNILVGCSPVDSGSAQLMPDRMKVSPAAAEAAAAGEVDIIEQIMVSRADYRRSLELLVDHYVKTGDNMKWTWAKKELTALDAIPQYNYIIEASLAGPHLKATTSIPEADDIYRDAVQLEKKAGTIIKDNELLRIVLDKYNRLIKKHPNSDKIDDVAFRAGRIYEHFRDYSIALLYYQRTYQWNPDTTHPARFKAAYILDKHLHRRAEALQLYQQAVEKEGRFLKYKKFAEMRIKELMHSSEAVE